MNVSVIDLIVIYSALYPIIPTYFVVPGIGSASVVVGFFLLLVIFIKNPKVKRMNSTGTERALILFSVCTIAISALHGAIQSAFWFFTSVVMAWAAYVQVVDERNKFNKVLDTIIVFSGILSTLAVVEAVTGFNPFLLMNNSGADIITVQRMGMTRAQSFTYQAITFGNYLTLTSALCIYRIVNCNNQKKKCLFKVLYGMMWLGAFTTLSRSVIGFFILCQILLGLALGLGKLILRILGILSILVIICFVNYQVLGKDSSILIKIFYLIMSVFDEKYVSGLSGVAFAEGNRLDLYSWVWDAIQGHLLIGFGPGATFSHDIVYGNAMYSTVVTKMSIEVEYLKCLYNYGIIGLISKVVFMFSVLVSSLKQGLKSRRTGNILSFEMAIGCAFLVYFVSFFTVMQDTESRVFYIMVFLLLAQRRNEIKLDSEHLEEV